jgi:MoaA/NifB/PqqE/SkfB family radical SAM enzyme
MKFSELPKNNKFCAHLWSGVHIEPTGKVRPCCIAQMQHDDSPVLIQNDNLLEVRTQDEWKRAREDLINGIENPMCKSCWDCEHKGITSYREMGNRQIGEDIHNIEIMEDGSLSEDQILLWDIRNTNLCNMKCVMCDPDFSSLYNKEAIDNEHKPYYFNSSSSDRSGNKTAVISALPDLDMKELVTARLKRNTKLLYWAGGEPLISKLHYDILEYLIDNNMTHIRMSYNTNMLKVNHYGKNIIDLWKNFDTVDIGASIDCVGERSEWARTGSDWNKINENINYLCSTFESHKTSNIVLTLNSTMSLYTIAGLPELLRWCNALGSELRAVMLRPIQHSDKSSYRLLSHETKNKIIVQVEEMLPDLNFTLDGWDFIKNDLMVPVHNLDMVRKESFQYHKRVSDFRNSNILDACPELKEIWNSYV